jgi:hypothetical protein
MGTKLTHELTYTATLAQVDAMLSDPAFREQVCLAQGAISQTVTMTEEAGCYKVVIDQTQLTDSIPAFAKKFVSDEVQMVQTELWTDTENATIEVVIPGKPGNMTGTIQLSEADGVVTESVNLDIKVNIPLVGGKIEAMIAGLLRTALKAENHVGKNYLAD